MATLSFPKSPNKRTIAGDQSFGESTEEYRAIKRHCPSIVIVDEIIDPAHYGRKLWDEALESSGESTREYRAIKRHYSSIVENLGKTVDPAHFARELWRESLISDDIVSKASVVGVLTGSERISPVIDAVLAQIKLRANVFQVFMRVLRAQNSYLADTIMEYYTSSLELHALGVLESVFEWEELGCQLNIDAEKLLQLSQCGRGLDYCREQVVSEWLEKDKGASWEKLCCALERMGREAEVSKITEQYISQSIDVPPATRLFDVAKEADKLEYHFINLTRRLLNEMVENETPVIELQHSISHLPIRIRKEHSKFIEDSIEKLSSARSIKQLFMYLNLYWNFFDCALLEHIIEIHGSKELKEEVEKYMEDLKIFRKNTTIDHLLKVYPNGFRKEEPPPDFSRIVSKLNREAGEYTLEELEQFRLRFCSQLSLPTFAVMLATVDNGSITITWYVPSSAVNCFHTTTIQWNSISTELIQFEADGLVLQFASKFNAQALEQYTAITHLYLGSQGIGADELAILSSSMRDKSLLQHLDLSGNTFGLKGAEYLAQILTKNSILVHLDLSDCDIDADGMPLLSSSLENKLCLQHLDLSGNMFGSKGANTLALALTENTALTHLDLSWCDIGADGIELLSSSLKNKTDIQYLDLRGNRFDYEKGDHLFIGNLQQERQDKELATFFSELLRNEQCPMCFEIMLEPIIVTCCGKSFCRECIGKLQASERTTCPLCQHHAAEFMPSQAGLLREDEEGSVTPPEGEFELEWPGQELNQLITTSQRRPRRRLGDQILRYGCVSIIVISLLVVIAVATLLGIGLSAPDTTTVTMTMQVSMLIYEEEVVLLTQLDPTIQSVDISESVSDSTDTHIISFYSINCDLLNYTSEPIADTLTANYSGGSIVPIQEFSYYASGSLVNLSISVLCYPMPCSGLSSVSFVFFTDYNEHLSFQDGSPLENLDYYAVEQTQLLSQSSLVSFPINSTEYYFVDLVLPKEDSQTYAVSLNITGTHSYLNITTYEKYIFCTLSRASSNQICTFERPLDDNTYCILAYVLGQSPSSEAIRYANVTSILNIMTEQSSSLGIIIFFSFLFLLGFLLAIIILVLIYIIIYIYVHRRASRP